ncbi:MULTISPECIES: hypothetical protein [Streptomyces]|uniref:hypothetical protein n=1 Tax=Streptomyces TaxID=1883 RepID=UPI00214B2897|nr:MULTISPECIES: hypothetical protein [Streptomyces]MDX3205153.1 hypothetical protein [Streptomyces scabiei]UUU32009.1 hypothetical protein JIX56_20025 [Streptomyces sp. CA-210063]
MARPTKAQRAAIAKRRADAIDLKLAGVDWLTIGRKLAADPAINSDRVAYPQGYGSDRYAKGQEPPTDDALIRAACKDVREALAQRTTDLDKSVEDLRAVEMERLDKLFFVAYRQAVRDGNLGAIDRALRIMERRAKYVPVEISQRLEVTGADGGPLHVETADLAELEALIAVTEEAAHGSDGQ